MSNTRRGLPLTSSRVEQVFPKLTTAQIRRVGAHGQIRMIERGEVLYEQGRSAAPFFVVVSGELEVVRPLFPAETLVTVSSPASSLEKLAHSLVGELSSLCVHLSLVR